MKNNFLSIVAFAIILCITSVGNAQTVGTLTLTYTPTAHSGYSGAKNVLAIWIQDANGAFVKSLYRRAGNGTKDHLPTWAVNSGGAANNCMSANCNVVSASTGATLTSYTQKNLTWDGTDVTGNTVDDGVYKITVESTWAHGAGGGAVRSFTFNKSSNDELQNPADDSNFTGISVNWVVASGAGISENGLSAVMVYPNPSTDGALSIDYQSATDFSIIDLLGNVLFEGQLDVSTKTKTIDVSKFTAGIYFVKVSDGTLSTTKKVMIE